MIYFSSYSTFKIYKFTEKTNFCIKHDNSIDVYYGNHEYNVLHNINGPARICLKTGKLTYWIDYDYLGTNLSNKEFSNEIKKTIFK